MERVVWTSNDEPDALDAENAWEGHTGGSAAAGEELGAVEAEGFDVDEDLAGVGGGHGKGFEKEGGGGAWGAEKGGFHGGGHF